MMTPVLSLETILSAMMCLCSGNNNSSYDIYSTLAEKVNYNQPKPTLLVPRDEIITIQNKLSNIDEQLTKLLKHQSEAPQIKLGLQPMQECPRNSIENGNSIYILKLPNYTETFPVLCSGNNNHGAGWMIIQQRLDGSENFLRSWKEYQQGFGLLNGEFFIGLDKLHALTTAKPQELIILLENFEGEQSFAKYDRFLVGSEAEKYEMKELGQYSGTAGDSLSYQQSQKFSTFDQDNDPSPNNCAEKFTAGGWYNDCLHSNLNGLYLRGEISDANFAKGISWLSFGGLKNSLKTAKMMIRSID